MPAPTISPLPTPPSRSTDPANFAVEADAFVAALPEFQTDANAQAAYLDGLAAAVDADAVAAAASAAAALASENAASDSETNAAASEAAAAVSETNAAASEVAAAASETAADISATNAASSAAEAEAIVAGIGFQDIIFVNAAMSPYSVTSATNGTLLACDTSSGNIVVNLPQISSLTLPFTIGAKKTTTDANTLTINRSGSDTFDDGSTSKVLATVSGYTLLPDTDTAPDVWVAIGFGGANAGPITGSGLTANSGKVLGRTSAGVGSIEEINAPTGAIVGTSDSQTLSNKTLEVPNITNGMTLTGDTGTLGQVLVSQGSGVAPIWASAGGAFLSEFTSSGTWTKPNNVQFVLVETWGGGGGGGRSTAGASNPAGAGAGGGAYNFRLFKASDLASSIAVTIGTGGTGASTNGGTGGTGGTTSFGSLLSSFGGAGGAGNATETQVNGGGGGGGVLSAGSSGGNHNIGGGSLNGGEPRIRDEGANVGLIRTQNTGGGSGGGSYTGSALSPNAPNGAPSSFGGGGGGACQTNAFGGGGNGAGGSGGTSSNGGGGGGAGGGRHSTSMTVGAGGAFTGTSGGGGAAGSVASFNGTAGAFRQGGGGGFGLYNQFFSGQFIANNGTQTVVAARGNTSGSTNTGYLCVSTDGLSSYTPYALPAGRNPTLFTGGLVYDGTKYVLAGNGYVISTTDFINFTTHTAIPVNFSSGNPNFVRLNGIFFAGTTSGLYYSSDLVTWTKAPIGSSPIVSIAFDGTRYYALSTAATDSTVYVSTDLTSWNSYNTFAVNPTSIGAKSGTVVVNNNSGSSPRVYYSNNNGVTWAGGGAGQITAQVQGLFTVEGRICATTTTPTLHNTNEGSSWGGMGIATPVSGLGQVIFNGSRFVWSASVTSGSNVTTTNVAQASTLIGGSYTFQTSTGDTTRVGGAGGAGGFAGGGGGGGGIGFTTTGNGGAGGAGFCRVYSW